MTSRRILIVTYFFAPSTAVGAARWTAMARHLRLMGHDVRVITSAVHGALASDAADGVTRTSDLGSSPLLRRALRRPGLAAPGAAPVVTPAPRLLTKVFVPDSHLVSWMPAVLAAARRAQRAGQVDCLITSGPPDSAHLLGLALGRRVAWIADFRDGWRFEPLAEPWPTRAQRAIEARLERAVATRADAVIGATRPIAEDFARRLGARAEWIPNGFDQAIGEDAARAAAPDVARDGWATLVHTGTLSGPRGRDPRPLLDALRHVNAERGERRVQLVLAGRVTSADEALLAEAALGESVRHLGLLDRGSAIALQRGADALLLLTGNDRSEATGKLFEYLHAGRPVLALAQDNEAQRIIELTGTGMTVAPNDPGAIAAALREVAAGSIGRHHAPRELERFTYPRPAAAVSALVDEVVEARSRRT